MGKFYRHHHITKIKIFFPNFKAWISMSDPISWCTLKCKHYWKQDSLFYGVFRDEVLAPLFCVCTKLFTWNCYQTCKLSILVHVVDLRNTFFSLSLSQLFSYFVVFNIQVKIIQCTYLLGQIHLHIFFTLFLTLTKYMNLLDMCLFFYTMKKNVLFYI